MLNNILKKDVLRDQSTVQVSQCYYQMRPSELIRDEIAMVT